MQTKLLDGFAALCIFVWRSLMQTKLLAGLAALCIFVTWGSFALVDYMLLGVGALSLMDVFFAVSFVVVFCGLVVIDYLLAMLVHDDFANMKIRTTQIVLIAALSSLLIGVCCLALPHIIETLPRYGYWSALVVLVVMISLTKNYKINGHLSVMGVFAGGFSLSLSIGLCYLSFNHIKDVLVTFLAECRYVVA